MNLLQRNKMAINTWDPGPQQLTQISVNDGVATDINASLIEGYSLETEKDAYDSALGISFDRGYTTKTGSLNCMDYAAVSDLEAMMTARDETTITMTYADATTQDVANAVIKVAPLVNLVPDVCGVWMQTSDGDYTSLEAGATALGITMSEPSFEFDYPFDGTDGCGRTYYGGTCRVTAEFELPGIRGVNTDVYAAAYAFEGTAVDVAFKMPNGKYLVLENVYAFVNYGAEDAQGVRTVHVRVTGVASAWSSMIKYTNGSATPLTDPWGTTTNGVHPGNKFSGCAVSFVATDYVEDDGAGGGVVDFTSA